MLENVYANKKIMTQLNVLLYILFHLKSYRSKSDLTVTPTVIASTLYSQWTATSDQKWYNKQPTKEIINSTYKKSIKFIAYRTRKYRYHHRYQCCCFENACSSTVYLHMAEYDFNKQNRSKKRCELTAAFKQSIARQLKKS